MVKRLNIPRSIGGATLPELVQLSQAQQLRLRRSFPTARGCDRAIVRGVMLQALVEHLSPIMREHPAMTVREALPLLKGKVLYSTEDRKLNAGFAALLGKPEPEPFA